MKQNNPYTKHCALTDTSILSLCLNPEGVWRSGGTGPNLLASTFDGKDG
jgi:hypothetical protein